jgi:hypothetical protein
MVSGCVPYMKMNPPADTDKPLPVPAGDNSCWMHTAANMLAGAGYGSGTTLEARANDVFADLSAQFGTANGGWTDTALTWWLASANNTWPANPYTVVTVYGNKSPRLPWANANGAQTIANELRNCNMVGLSISWPTDAPGQIGSGGHAITGWGDNIPSTDPLSANPGQVRVTDSDTDDGGNVQAYTYDTYTNPNPGGANEGNGWYFDYDPNHPYIKHIITLTPTDDPTDDWLTQRVIGSYEIHQTSEVAATDLHYTVGTDVDILTYRTQINYEPAGTPAITESQPRRDITVDWDLTEKPVPTCTWVRITTEFVLPAWNAIWYDDVHFTYPDGIGSAILPYLAWDVETPVVDRPEAIPNVTGGYLIGSLDIFDPNSPDEPAVRYRFVHQYSYTQSPEFHVFALEGSEGAIATNLRFGHSYGYPTPEELWEFEEWMTEISEGFRLGEEPVRIEIDWEGRLPYPEGEDITGRIADPKNGLGEAQR